MEGGVGAGLGDGAGAEDGLFELVAEGFGEGGGQLLNCGGVNC